MNQEKKILILKWGTIKGSSGIGEHPEIVKLFREYQLLGTSSSGVTTQYDTKEQKEVICKIIDLVDIIENDWSGENMSKKEAKKYVMEY